MLLIFQDEPLTLDKSDLIAVKKNLESQSSVTIDDDFVSQRLVGIDTRLNIREYK